MEEFAQTLKSIGDGSYPIVDELGEDIIKLPETWISQSENIEDFFSEIFPNIEQNYLDHDWLSERAILTPTNKQMHEINRIESIDSNIDYNSSGLQYPEELLNTIELTELPQHKLTLKKNAIIMTLRNLDKKNGICNGTRLKVLSFTQRVIYALILTGPKKGNTYIIPRIKLKTNESSPILFCRLQFPVRLPFAMTINKAQGQTLQKIGLYLRLQLLYSILKCYFYHIFY